MLISISMTRQEHFEIISEMVMRPIGLANLRSSRANRWHIQFKSKSETRRWVCLCVCVCLSAAGEHCYSLFPPRSHWILQFYARFKCAPYHSPSLWHQAKHTHSKATALQEKKISRKGRKKKPNSRSVYIRNVRFLARWMEKYWN